MKPPKAAAKIDRPFPTLMLELEARAAWNGHVCGVDEAGRGPWAGPVSAAAVILNPDDLPPGIDDSKALTEKRRAARSRPWPIRRFTPWWTATTASSCPAR